MMDSSLVRVGDGKLMQDCGIPGRPTQYERVAPVRVPASCPCEVLFDASRGRKCLTNVDAANFNNGWPV